MSHSSGNSLMGRGVSASCCARAISSLAPLPRDSESDTGVPLEKLDPIDGPTPDRQRQDLEPVSLDSEAWR